MSQGADGAEQPDPEGEAPAAPVESQFEPRDDVLRFAASADELAQRIWNGQGTDLNHLIDDAIQSRDQQRAA